MAKGPFGERDRGVIHPDRLVRFRCRAHCGQGDYDADQITVLVRNAPSYEAACNHIKIAAPRRGWGEVEGFEDMTIDLEGGA